MHPYTYAHVRVTLVNEHGVFGLAQFIIPFG